MVAGHARSNASLSVFELPVSFIEPLTDQVGPERSEVTVVCKVSRPEVNVTWIRYVMHVQYDFQFVTNNVPSFEQNSRKHCACDRDGRIPIQNCNKYEMKSDGVLRTLTVHDVTYDDEVSFVCDAQDCKSTAKLSIVGK